MSYRYVTIEWDTSALEAADEPAEDESNLLHLYCRYCLEDLYPQRIPPHCGVNRPRNEDEMVYPSGRLVPPQDLCVVCADLVTESFCSRCGA